MNSVKEGYFMTSLNIDELTIEQKIGQLLMVRGFIDEEDREFIYHMMKNRSVGAIQVPPALTDYKKEIEEIKKHTDYPIIIYADMERGFPKSEYRIPCAMALSITDDEELAYQFGTVTAIEAKKNGYSAIGGPVVDLLQGSNMFNVPRSFGEDLDHVSRMTSAVLRGEMDNGILGIMKHWPIAPDVRRDDHVFDDKSQLTEEDIMNSVIVPYLHAMKHENLGAIMSAHAYYPKIDDTYPATLSEKLIGILRGQGYDGVLMTDSFAMLGILQNFGEENGYGMAIKAGHDIVLPNYRTPFKKAYEYLLNSYKKGVFTEERLNEAVRRVITAQNYALRPATATVVSEYQKKCFEAIEQKSICMFKDEEIQPALLEDTKKLFVLIKENEYQDDTGVPYEITFLDGIAEDNVDTVKRMVQEKFPGSAVETANLYPCAPQIEAVCKAAVDAEEVIFVTHATSSCYTLGGEFTPRLIHMMEAVEEKLAAIIHIGNPYPLEEIPHFPRVIISIGGRENCIEHGLSVLKGEFVPKGKLPFVLNLK